MVAAIHMQPENDPFTLFPLEVMRLRETDVEMLQQVQKKNGTEMVAFVCDWWSTRSRQILLEMCEAGRFDQRARDKLSHISKSRSKPRGATFRMNGADNS